MNDAIDSMDNSKRRKKLASNNNRAKYSPIKGFEIRPLKNNKHAIVFAINDNYSKFLAICIQSLIDNSRNDKEYDIVVLGENISKDNAARLKSIVSKNFTLRFYNPDEFISKQFPNIDLKPKGPWPKAMYYRIFIPFLMNEYDKVLYLDSDIVANKNIDPIFEIDLEDKELAVVRTTISMQNAESRFSPAFDYYKNVLGIEDCCEHFCSGVILFNIKKINLEKYFHKINLTFNSGIDYIWPDQDILNCIFYKQTKFISPIYGWCVDYKFLGKEFYKSFEGKNLEEFKRYENEAVILHYDGGLKPWKIENNFFGKYWDIFWKYARKTPYYEEIMLESVRNIVSNSKRKKPKETILKKIFSVKNESSPFKEIKVIRIFGIKFKFKVKDLTS